MNEYRGKHAPSTPWPVASSASVPVRTARHLRKNKHRRIKWILLLIFLLLLAVWPFLEARILTTDQVILKSEALPADANHLRVVFLSDIHWGFWYTDGDLGRLVATVNFSDYESRMFFDRVLREAGVFERMEAMGVQDGDTVSMYDLMFEYKS